MGLETAETANTTQSRGIYTPSITAPSGAQINQGIQNQLKQRSSTPASPASSGNFLQGLGGTLAAVSGPLGLAVGLAGSVMSFADAKKQRENQVAAQLEADKAFEEAGRILEEQYMSGVSIPMEAYDLEREGIAQAGAQAIEAISEGEARGASAGVGRVVALQQDALAKQRAALAERQFQLEKAQAEELAKLQQGRLGLKLGEVQGQQQMLADMRAQEAASRLSGVQALGQTATDLFETFTPLFNPKKED